jgi:Tfp pilus assembly protein PilP
MPVTINVLAKAQASSTYYQITISGPGMTTIGPDKYDGGQTIYLYVPKGLERVFLFERFNQDSVRIDSYTTKSDIGSGMNEITVTLASATPALTSFSFETLSVGTINETAKTVAVTVPFGTSVTALVANFVSNGVSVKVGPAVQVSGTTANNFTSPVTYTVTSADSTTLHYVVTVTTSPKTAKALSSFSFATLAVTGLINDSAKTVAVTVPYGTVVTALVATIVSNGASVTVGSAVQVSGTTANNFTAPVTYTVTAADSTTQNYVVTVTISPKAAKTLNSFSFSTLAATGIINDSAKTVAVIVPYGTVVTALVATFASTGASVKVDSAVQVSGATANNFSSAVTYTVMAADSTTQNYVVTVTTSPKVAKTLNSFSFATL